MNQDEIIFRNSRVQAPAGQAVRDYFEQDLKGENKTMAIKISVFSEDGASVYEARDENGKLVDSLYIGFSDWVYGDREEINKKITEWEEKFK